MFTLYHVPLSPFCRKVRIVLGEKKLAFDLASDAPLLPRPDFSSIDPDGEGPVLVDDAGSALAEATAIAEYIEERHPSPPLFPDSPVERAEVRRLANWFDRNFGSEVTDCLVGEKVLKRLATGGSPDSRVIHRGRENLRHHLDYASWLLDQRKWLAGERFSMADVTASAHVSSLDYVDDVPWNDYPVVKDWYARIKSRPSFRALLKDRLAGASPPEHYADLDF